MRPAPPLAYLMNDGPVCGFGDATGLTFASDLLLAVLLLLIASVAWFLALLLARPRGRPLRVPVSFWYAAAPAGLGLAGWVLWFWVRVWIG